MTIEVSFTKKDFSFKDVKENDWFYEAVKYVNDRGLMNGTSSDTFSPNLSTTRGMIVTILWRLEGEPNASRPMTFTDAPADSYYANAIKWASEKGIVDGYDAEHFGPDNKLTREDGCYSVPLRKL